MISSDKKKLEQIAAGFHGKHVAVVGDLMLDAYTWGKVSRISPEAPVPVVQVVRRTFCLGGAANVMRNIVTLGGRVTAFGMIGKDSHGEKLLSLLGEYGIDSSGILLDPQRPTTFKERVIAGSQQLLRLDDELQVPIGPEAREKLLKRFENFLNQEKPDAVVLEDYAKGLFCEATAQRMIDLCRERSILVSLDPKPRNPMRLHGLTLMKPNRSEAISLAGVTDVPEVCTMEFLTGVADTIRKQWQVKYLLISLAEQGMALFSEDGKSRLIPTRAKEVFDVSGAGDTVIAASTLALTVQDDPAAAAEIANYAAGVVVGKLGTATVSREELMSSFHL